MLGAKGLGSHLQGAIPERRRVLATERVDGVLKGHLGDSDLLQSHELVPRWRLPQQERDPTPKRSVKRRSSLQIQLLGGPGDPFNEAAETSALVTADLPEPVPQ